jgi:hypothetical protein
VAFSIRKLVKIYIQWAKRNAEDWKQYNIVNANQVRALVKRGVPKNTDRVDDKEGWYCGLNCQGIDFTGHDHVAIEPVDDGLRITAWTDDEEDQPEKVAVEWTLLKPKHDPRVGQINTVQSRRLWVNDELYNQLPDSEKASILPWSQFVEPPADLTLHGIWLSDEDFERHVNTRTLHGWREWING